MPMAMFCHVKQVTSNGIQGFLGEEWYILPGHKSLSVPQHVQ